MGKLLSRLTSQLKSKGNKTPRQTAIKLLRDRGHMEKDSLNLTKEGKKRESMSAAERAIDRASKYSGRDERDYVYSSKTNRATLK